MSKILHLELNRPEETISIDLNLVVAKCELPSNKNPISDYFSHTQELIARFIRPEIRNDVTALSLLLLGVVSAAEFYFRSVLVQCLDVCPYALNKAKRAQIPLASIFYYGFKPRSFGMSVFEHKSLAGSDEIKNEVNRLLDVKIQNGSSIATALEGFDVLCELRHAVIHTRGYISSKGASDLEIECDAIQRVNITQESAFELTKLAHNAVRSFNRFLMNEMLDRWISSKYLTGVWRKDKKYFKNLFDIFVYPEESPYADDAREAYKKIQPSLISRFKNE